MQPHAGPNDHILQSSSIKNVCRHKFKFEASSSPAPQLHVDDTVHEFVFPSMGFALRGKVKENFELPLIPFQVLHLLLVRHANRPE